MIKKRELSTACLRHLEGEPANKLGIEGTCGSGQHFFSADKNVKLSFLISKMSLSNFRIKCY